MDKNHAPPCLLCGEPNSRWLGTVAYAFCESCQDARSFFWAIWYFAVAPMRLIWPADAPPPKPDEWNF